LLASCETKSIRLSAVVITVSWKAAEQELRGDGDDGVVLDIRTGVRLRTTHAADAEAGRYSAGFRREGIELRSTVSREVAIRKAITDLREGAPLVLKQSHIAIGNSSFCPRDRGFAQSHRSIYLIDLRHKTGLRETASSMLVAVK